MARDRDLVVIEEILSGLFEPVVANQVLEVHGWLVDGGFRPYPLIVAQGWGGWGTFQG